MSPDNQRALQFRNGLRNEREIYQTLIEIAEKQGTILAGGQTEEILALAQAKEGVLDRIESAERELTPVKEEWPRLRDSIDPALRREVEEELDGIEAVLRNLIELETRGQQGIQERRDETAQRIKSVEGGRRVQQAYQQGGSNATPRFLDRSE